MKQWSFNEAYVSHFTCRHEGAASSIFLRRRSSNLTEFCFLSSTLLTRPRNMVCSPLSTLSILLRPLVVTKVMMVFSINPKRLVLASVDVAWLLTTALLACIGHSFSVGCSLDTTWSVRGPSVSSHSEEAHIASILVGLHALRLWARRFVRFIRSGLGTWHVIKVRVREIGESCSCWLKEGIGSRRYLSLQTF